MKLHIKLLLLLVPLVATPVTAVGWLAYLQQKDSLEQESLRQMHGALGQISQHTQARLIAARANVALFAESTTLRRYLLVEDERQRYQLLQPRLLKLFRSYQQAYPGYFEIRVLLPDGYEDTRSTLYKIPNLTDEEADTDYFRRLSRSGDGVTMQVIRYPDTGQPALLLSKPVRLIDPSVDPILAEPRLRGYLVVTASLDFLQQQIAATGAGRNRQVFFTDGNGELLFEDGGRNAEIPFGTLMKSVRGAEPVERNGYTLALSGRRVHDALYVFGLLHERDLHPSIEQVALIAILLILGTIALTSTLLYAVLNSLLLKPLARLGRAVVAIGRGEAFDNVGISRGSEIGELAHSFETMGRSLRKSHQQIAHLAYHDSLTDLPNRRLFTELLERALAHARRLDGRIGVLFLDLDDFKRVNDSLGHQAGDSLLREVAERLLGVVREHDLVAHRDESIIDNTVARLGGDEFVILLPGLHDPLHAASVAERIIHTLSQPVLVDRQALHVKTSIGITTFPDDGDSAERLMKNADIAMYHAKEKGKNHFQFFTNSMNQALLARLGMENALRYALDENQLVLHYQPQVDTQTGEVHGVEALVRWCDPQRGMIAPGDFIPLAEENGLIVPIGNWVLREACRQNKAWQDAGLAPVRVSVNISARQFMGVGLSDTVQQTLTETGLAARYLDLELTETAIMNDVAVSQKVLHDLKGLGVSISMDDFGTGYSSLGLLKRLPIDCLKIDRSFIDDIGSGDNESGDAAITAMIIAMSRSLNLVAVAEGVENAPQLEYLRAHGCDRIQGYFACRPLPVEQITALLRAGEPLLELPALLASGNDVVPWIA